LKQFTYEEAVQESERLLAQLNELKDDENALREVLTRRLDNAERIVGQKALQGVRARFLASAQKQREIKEQWSLPASQAHPPGGPSITADEMQEQLSRVLEHMPPEERSNLENLNITPDDLRVSISPIERREESPAEARTSREVEGYKRRQAERREFLPGGIRSPQQGKFQAQRAAAEARELERQGEMFSKRETMIRKRNIEEQAKAGGASEEASKKEQAAISEREKRAQDREKRKAQAFSVAAERERLGERAAALEREHQALADRERDLEHKTIAEQRLKEELRQKGLEYSQKKKAELQSLLAQVEQQEQHEGVSKARREEQFNAALRNRQEHLDMMANQALAEGQEKQKAANKQLEREHERLRRREADIEKNYEHARAIHQGREQKLSEMTEKVRHREYETRELEERANARDLASRENSEARLQNLEREEEALTQRIRAEQGQKASAEQVQKASASAAAAPPPISAEEASALEEERQRLDALAENLRAREEDLVASEKFYRDEIQLREASEKEQREYYNDARERLYAHQDEFHKAVVELQGEFRERAERADERERRADERSAKKAQESRALSYREQDLQEREKLAEQRSAQRKQKEGRLTKAQFDLSGERKRLKYREKAHEDIYQKKFEEIGRERAELEEQKHQFEKKVKNQPKPSVAGFMTPPRSRQASMQISPISPYSPLTPRKSPNLEEAARRRATSPFGNEGSLPQPQQQAQEIPVPPGVEYEYRVQEKYGIKPGDRAGMEAALEREQILRDLTVARRLAGLEAGEATPEEKTRETRGLSESSSSSLASSTDSMPHLESATPPRPRPALAFETEDAHLRAGVGAGAAATVAAGVTGKILQKAQNAAAQAFLPVAMLQAAETAKEVYDKPEDAVRNLMNGAINLGIAGAALGALGAIPAEAGLLGAGAGALALGGIGYAGTKVKSLAEKFLAPPPPQEIGDAVVGEESGFDVAVRSKRATDIVNPPLSSLPQRDSLATGAAILKSRQDNQATQIPTQSGTLFGPAANTANAALPQLLQGSNVANILANQDNAQGMQANTMTKFEEGRRKRLMQEIRQSAPDLDPGIIQQLENASNQTLEDILRKIKGDPNSLQQDVPQQPLNVGTVSEYEDENEEVQRQQGETREHKNEGQGNDSGYTTKPFEYQQPQQPQGGQGGQPHVDREEGGTQTPYNAQLRPFLPVGGSDLVLDTRADKQQKSLNLALFNNIIRDPETGDCNINPLRMNVMIQEAIRLGYPTRIMPTVFPGGTMNQGALPVETNQICPSKRVLEEIRACHLSKDRKRKRLTVADDYEVLQKRAASAAMGMMHGDVRWLNNNRGIRDQQHAAFALNTMPIEPDLWQDKKQLTTVPLQANLLPAQGLFVDEQLGGGLQLPTQMRATSYKQDVAFNPFQNVSWPYGNPYK
jgi:hypothetical protein